MVAPIDLAKKERVPSAFRLRVFRRSHFFTNGSEDLSNCHPTSKIRSGYSVFKYSINSTLAARERLVP